MNRIQIKKIIRQKKILRFLLFPVIRIRREIRLKQYQKCEDAQYMKRMRGIHKGERCFVIGNGPSLTPEDLSVLAANDEISFGSNRIFKIFPRTNWRPTYYVCMDSFVLAEEIEHIRKMGPFPKFLNYRDYEEGEATEENFHYICPSAEFKIDANQLVSSNLSEDLSKYNAQSPSVTVAAIELAIYMGFTNIYLLGVDNNYAYKRRSDGTIYVDTTVKQVYFAGGEPDKSVLPPVQVVDQMLASYRIAREFAENHGVKIYNATRGGKLEVFERVDFDELMGQKKAEVEG